MAKKGVYAYNKNIEVNVWKADATDLSPGIPRKGSMFFASEKGVKNAMLFHTIIETCKQASIMVKDYLTYVLSELNRGNNNYVALLHQK